MKKAKGLSAWFKRSSPIVRHRFNEPHFKPYAAAIGELILAWNDLHERLAMLFAQAMVSANVKQSLAIWHKTRADMTKRNLLDAAIKTLSESELKGRPKVVKEIAWILTTTKDLEGLRDDSVHGPLHALPKSIFEMDKILAEGNIFGLTVRPNNFFGNTRAQRLNEKATSLLRDFKYAKQRILILRDYAIAIDTAWANVQIPWPDRPELPDRNSSRKYKGSAKRRKPK